MTHPVLELQAADTMADQLRHRRSALAEREVVQSARNALVRWDQQRTVARKRMDELTREIGELETETTRFGSHREKLQQQLRQIISPREAEALQREIATLEEQSRHNDDLELEKLEEQSRLDDQLSELADQEPALREEYLAADAALSAVSADIDNELQRVADRLEQLRADVDKKVLKRYDRLRKDHLIAAANLAGSRCDGCHLDLSAAEIDAIRDEAANGTPADCPQCGRLIVV